MEPIKQYYFWYGMGIYSNNVLNFESIYVQKKMSMLLLFIKRKKNEWMVKIRKEKKILIWIINIDRRMFLFNSNFL